jgi:hypothetical protein
MTHTITSTIARARFANAGGSPSGFQDTKTRMAAMDKIEPKPPKRYCTVLMSQREGGDEKTFRPYSVSRFATSSSDKPCSLVDKLA